MREETDSPKVIQLVSGQAEMTANYFPSPSLLLALLSYN